MRTELVGRQAELGEFVGALDRAVSGAGGVVLVAGPAGIGKTRLCDELYEVARARGLAAGWTACWEAAPVLTLAPWLDLLGQLGSTIDPTPVSDDPAVARAMLFERVLSALRDLARREPLLLVIDDLQWAAPISVQLLGRVLGPLRGLPVLLLATVRTDLGGSVDDTQVRELARHCDMVALSPLDDDAIAAVATARIGAALSDRLRHELVTRAAGNPLFACELAGLLSTADPAGRDAWVASATHGVSHALRSLLLRPLEGLSGASREVLAG